MNQTLQNSSVGAVILFAAIFLAVFLVAMPVGFLLLKRRGSGGGSAASPASSSPADFGKPDNWQPPAGQAVSDDRREQLLRNLDTVDRGVSKFYVVLVCLVMAAITGLAVFFYVKLPDDGNRDFVILYGGVLYAIGMLWGLAQLLRTMRRITPPPGFPLGVATPRINVTFQTSPQMEFIGKDALDRAQKHLDAGGSIDEACALADPKYNSMNGMMQKIFQTAIQASIDERRKTQQP